MTCWEVTTADALKWCNRNHQDFTRELLAAASEDEVCAARAELTEVRRRQARFLSKQIERLEEELACFYKHGSDSWKSANKELASKRQEFAWIESVLNCREANAGDEGKSGKGRPEENAHTNVKTAAAVTLSTPVAPPKEDLPVASARKRGDALEPAERAEYEKVLRIAKRLTLRHRAPGNTRKIIQACAEKNITVDAARVRRIQKWGDARKRRGR